jgi:hypothetical protein
MAEGRKTSLQAVSQSTEDKKRTVRRIYHYQERETTKNCASRDFPLQIAAEVCVQSFIETTSESQFFLELGR